MSDSNQEWTCGMGLALASELPARMSTVLDVMGRNMELHTRSLNRANPASYDELIAYQKLIGRVREVSGSLLALAGEMDSYRDLPMGPHIEPELHTPEVTQAFRDLIQSERDLSDYLLASIDAFTSVVEG